MNFEEAEARFRELQARVQRGEPISRAEYEDQVSQLAVQDRNGVLWEINPRTGKWMYFDGAEWVSGTPPGHDTSAVIPMGGKAAGTVASSAPTNIAPPEPASPPPPPPSILSSAPEMPASPLPAPLPTPPPPPMSITRAAPPPPPPIAPAVRPASTPVPSRPITPPGASAPPAGPKGSPEPLKTHVRPQERLAPPPVAPSAGAPGRAAERGSPLAVFGPNREWVPLAIGAVVLLLCAILLFVGGNVALKAFGGTGTTVTPTRTLVVSLPATPLPTVVRLPTEPPPTPTPEAVVAKVTERSVNVRSGPSTKNKIVSSVKQNNQITLIGRNSDSTWFQINVAGGGAPGWISGQTIQIVSGDTNSLPVVGPTPTPTKAAAAARPVQPSPTATLAPLGTLPSPTPNPYP